MKRSTSIRLPAILVPVLVCGQSNITRRSDGSEVDYAKSPSGYERILRVPSVNGGMVPNEKVEERVLSRDASGSVIERFITKYDQNGNPGTREKVRIEEKVLPGGGSSTTTTIFRSNLNGGLDLAERSVAQSRKSGDAVNTTVSVERPSINGSLEAVERRESVAGRSGDTTRATVTVFRLDAAGRYSEALRETVERVETKDKTSENTTQYELGPSGNLRLTRQSAATTVKGADGSTSKEVTVYEATLPGRAGDPYSAKPMLREQQLIESRPGPGGTVVETVGVRRPSASDPGRVAGSYQTISESVCKGNCK